MQAAAKVRSEPFVRNAARCIDVSYPFKVEARTFCEMRKETQCARDRKSFVGLTEHESIQIKRDPPSSGFENWRRGPSWCLKPPL